MATRSRTGNGAEAEALKGSTLYTHHPFLSDAATVKYIKDSNILFLMRGLPGSGKTTLVERIKDKYRGARACSADDYFLRQDGSYCFRRDHLSAAHSACQQRARDACESGKRAIIIDNTNICKWEMNAYIRLASEYGYTVIVAMPDTPWRFNARCLSQKNKHGVSSDMLEKKVQAFERALPVYWGWFLNVGDSQQLLRLAERYYAECARHFAEFGKCVSATHPYQRRSAEKSRSSFASYFDQAPSSRNLHCTAYFAGSPHSDGSNLSQTQSYASRPVVEQAMGRTYKLRIVGFVFTPHTAGARLRLSRRQLKLWAQNDWEQPPSCHASGTGGSRSCSYQSHGASSSYSPHANKGGSRRPGNATVIDKAVPSHKKHICDAGELPNIGALHIGSGADTASENKDVFDGQGHSRFHPLCGVGSRAHITLGCRGATTAVQTGFDLIEMVQCEARSLESNDHVKVGGAAIRYYGNGCCVVYLDSEIEVSSLFSGHWQY